MKQRDKGESIISFPDNYIMIDIETTGLSAQWDSIIEVAALKVRGGEIVDDYLSFVEYNDELPEYITELTGITNEMLIGAPSPEIVMKELYDFIDNDIIVGYNVNFDINFLYDYFGKYLNVQLKNNYIDCMRISRKLYPEEKHHRLKDMVKILKINIEGEHRALDDCNTTKKVFDELHKEVFNKFESETIFLHSFKKKSHSNCIKVSEIIADCTEFDVTHPIYGKCCVFTGTLERMTRKEAMQVVVNLGGEVSNSVTSKTNYLILGNNDYCPTIKNGKSRKQEKAEQLLLQGKDISILDENTFYDLIKI